MFNANKAEKNWMKFWTIKNYQKCTISWLKFGLKNFVTIFFLYIINFSWNFYETSSKIQKKSSIKIPKKFLIFSYKFINKLISFIKFALKKTLLYQFFPPKFCNFMFLQKSQRKFTNIEKSIFIHTYFLNIFEFFIKLWWQAVMQ